MSIQPPKHFVSLHNHTGFSVYDGLGYPNEHIDWCIENGLDAWALTEHGHANSFAHAQLYVDKLEKAGKSFKFIPGVEAYIHPDLKAWKVDHEMAQAAKDGNKAAKRRVSKKTEDIVTPLVAIVDKNDEAEDVEMSNALTVENEEETKSTKFFNPVNRRHHLVILPKTSIGLQRIFHLVSRGYAEGFYRFPRIDIAMLKEAAHGGHIMVSSACIGGPFAFEVFQSIQKITFEQLESKLLDDPSLIASIHARIANTYDMLADAVGLDNVYLELQFNRIAAQHLVNRALTTFAKARGLTNRLVVTADSHYARPEQWRDREIYKKLGWLNYSNIGPESIPKTSGDLKCELYPKNAAQIWDEYMKSKPGNDFYEDSLIAEACERTWYVAHEEVGDIVPDRSVKLPSYVVPTGKTPIKALIDECKEGLMARGLADKPEYVQRVKDELDVIKARNFVEYFLTKQAIIKVARRAMLVGPGRGSGAGSLVNYVLGITDVNPVRWELMFERFCNIHRHELPDIDSDFADRDRLIDLLSAEFGAENVVPISNYNTFKLKTLVKDISRFYDIPFDEVNKATATVEHDVRKATTKHGDDKNLFVLTYEDALVHSPSFKAFIDAHPEVANSIGTLFKQNRSLGRHAGGVIVSERIGERMPLVKSKLGMQTPWVEGVNFKHLEEFGWVKFDLLGLETLRIIERAIELILKKQGMVEPTFDDVKAWFNANMHPDVIDFDDQRVYEYVYHSGRWAGVFQCTQRGAQKFFERAKPKSLVDIATLTSIFRPGPLAAKVDDLYVKHATGEPYKWGHPLINKTLEPTKGLIIFQEQVMQLAHEVAGFPKSECDKVRKAIMKRSISGGEEAKRKAQELRDSFVKGSINNGLSKEVADDLYDKILYFAGYGFNKSHAISYAMDSFFCAWMLTYHEEEWLCAYAATMAVKDPEKKAKAIEEVRGLGYSIAPVDINLATNEWRVLEGKRLMPSFSTIKSVGNTAVQEIVEKRPYHTIDDLLWNEDGTWKHSKFNKRSMDALIKMGAFGSMGIVGPGRLFSSYKHMQHVIIENADAIKKTTKRDPLQGKTNFYDLLVESMGMEEWSRSELSEMRVELQGSLDVAELVPQQVLTRLNEKEIKPIDQLDEEQVDIVWFVVIDSEAKTTKNNRPYLLMKVAGLNGKTIKLRTWGWDGKTPVESYAVCLAEVKRDGFGCSTTMYKVKKLA